MSDSCAPWVTETAKPCFPAKLSISERQVVVPVFQGKSPPSQVRYYIGFNIDSLCHFPIPRPKKWSDGGKRL